MSETGEWVCEKLGEIIEKRRMKMIIVNLMGGIGNQLFQYALGKKLQNLGKDVVYDVRCLEQVKQMDYPLIDVFPNIRMKIADDKDIERLGDYSRKMSARIRRRLLHKIYKTRITEDLEKKPGVFCPEVLGMNNVYLNGYWQNEKYFKDIRTELLHEFSFPEILMEKNRELCLRIEHGISVSVHVRRGDYLEGKARGFYGGCCTDAYYDKAIHYFKDKYSDIYFYFFSNDPEWVRKHFVGHNVTVVDWNQGTESYWDIYLMSKCRHNIVANSSFSWWGAWLNQHEDKEIVAPYFWVNPAYVDNVVDTACDEWIKIKG